MSSVTLCVQCRKIVPDHLKGFCSDDCKSLYQFSRCGHMDGGICNDCRVKRDNTSEENNKNTSSSSSSVVASPKCQAEEEEEEAELARRYREEHTAIMIACARVNIGIGTSEDKVLVERARMPIKARVKELRENASNKRKATKAEEEPAFVSKWYTFPEEDGVTRTMDVNRVVNVTKSYDDGDEDYTIIISLNDGKDVVRNFESQEKEQAMSLYNSLIAHLKAYEQQEHKRIKL